MSLCLGQRGKEWPHCPIDYCHSEKESESQVSPLDATKKAEAHQDGSVCSRAKFGGQSPV